jgi:hypothetical protein
MPHDLGPRPEPRIDPGDPPPGGVDAVDVDTVGEPLVPDLPPERNPGVDDQLPEETRSGEDTSTQATEDADEPMRAEQESPA